MRKVISSKDGYSLFIEQEKEKEMKCTAYITGDHMKGQEIADVIGLSKSAVSQIIKRSMKKIYYSMKYRYDCNSIEAVCLMANLFNVQTEEQYDKFFKLFPQEIKGEVRYEAFKTA